VLKVAGGTPIEVKTSLQDLSFTGISVIAEQAIEPGTVVTVEITDLAVLRGTFTLGTGKVVRVSIATRDKADVFRTGVRFITTDQSLLQRLILAIRKPPPKVKSPVKTAAIACKRSASWL
jgi:c-di-GMP-binding flagellar brake protein YcgR